MNGCTASQPRYGLIVSASPIGCSPAPRGSSHASAYACAVEPMSPRFASATTSRPCSRAAIATASSAASPYPPRASKKATCGLTAAATPATASTIPTP